MVPAQLLGFKKQQRKNHENGKRNGFLDGFKLNQIKRAAIFFKTTFVGWHLKQIFKKSQAPTDNDDSKQTQIFAPGVVFKFEVAVPGKRHEGVGDEQEQDCF